MRSTIQRIAATGCALLLLALAPLVGCNEADVVAADLSSASGDLLGPTPDAAVDSRVADFSSDSIDMLVAPDQGAPLDLGNLTLVVNLGDSIAAGFGVSKSYAKLLLVNDDNAYPTYAGRDLTTRFAQIALIDRAEPGATSDRLNEQVMTVPDNPSGNTLVLISAGGNDLLQNYQALLDAAKVATLADEVGANVKVLTQRFADPARYPNETFFLLFNVFDPSDDTGTIPEGARVTGACTSLKDFGALVGPAVVANLGVFNQRLAAFAQTLPELRIADIHGMFLGHGFHHDQSTSPHYDAADPSLWFASDCIHPNQRGHHELRRLLWEVLGLEQK